MSNDLRTWPIHLTTLDRERLGDERTMQLARVIRALERRAADAEEIVRDLAECDPMVDPDPMPSWCILCVGQDKAPDANGDRTHSPSCPFRRARESVAIPPAADSSSTHTKEPK